MDQLTASHLRTDGGVAVVTLSRPGSANALTGPMVDELLTFVGQVETARCTALVLRSSEPQFCAGFDLDTDTETTADLTWRFLRIGLLLERLRSSPMLTVAVLDGAAVGAGADIAAACDVRIGTRRASLRFPGSAFGVVLGTRRLAGLVGESLAVRLAATGEKLRAPEALAAGLLDLLVEPEEIDEAVQRFTTPAGDRDPSVLAGLKAAAHPGNTDPAALADLARSLATRPTLVDDLRRFRERGRRGTGEERA